MDASGAVVYAFGLNSNSEQGLMAPLLQAWNEMERTFTEGKVSSLRFVLKCEIVNFEYLVA